MTATKTELATLYLGVGTGAQSANNQLAAVASQRGWDATARMFSHVYGRSRRW